MFIRSVGTFNACVKPELKIGGTPSRTEVTDTLVKLTRKTILSYNARIVETGAALRVRHILLTYISYDRYALLSNLYDISGVAQPQA